MQAPVASSPFTLKDLRINAFAVVSHSQAKLGFIVSNFELNMSRLSVTEWGPQRLTGNPIDFVSKDRMEISRRAFHRHLKVRTTMVAFIGCQFFSNDSYCKTKIVDLDSRRTQPLNGVAALGNGFSGLVNGAGEVLLSLDRTRGETIVHRVETKEESVETIQHSALHFTPNTCSFTHAPLQPHFAF